MSPTPFALAPLALAAFLALGAPYAAHASSLAHDASNNTGRNA